MNKRKLINLALCLALVAAVSVKPAMAYFTDVTEASGMVQVKIANTPTKAEEPDTELGSMIKTITIQNTGSSDAYVRVRAVAGSNYTVTMNSSSDAGWTAGTDASGAYFEYKLVLKPQEKTEKLVLDLGVIDGTITNDFNVIIVQESCVVHYDENGNPYPDWSHQIETITENVEGEVYEENH